MYCRNCGKQIVEGSKFCQNCGQEIESANAEQISETTKSSTIPKPHETLKSIDPPATINAPPLPAMTGKSQSTKPIKAPKQNTKQLPQKPALNKKKKHGFRKFIKVVIFSLLSVPVLALIALLALTISKSWVQKSDIADNINEINYKQNLERLSEEDIEGLNVTTSETTIAKTYVTTPDITPAPTRQNDSNMKEYTSPVYETEVPLYTVLTDGTWVLSGIADNPDKIGGEDGKYTLEALNGYMLSCIFKADNTLTMIEENQGESIEMGLQYEIMDIHYCDTYAFADGTGYRFYLGSDGFLYMCEYEGDEYHSDFSDFYVLKPLAP